MMGGPSLSGKEGRVFQKISRRSLFLILFDVVGILVAYLAAFRFAGGAGSWVCLEQPFFIFSIFLFPACFHVFDLYYPFKFFKTGYTLIDVAFGVFAGVAILGISSFWTRAGLIPRGVFIFFAVCLFGYVFGMRKIYDFFFQARFLDKKALIVGTGSLAREIAAVIRRTPNAGIEIAGFVAEKEGRTKKEVDGIPVVGHFEKLVSLVSWHNIQLVVLALEDENETSEIELTQVLLKRSLNITSAIYLFENLEEALPAKALSRQYLLSLMSEVRRQNYLKIKRFIDISGALLLLLVFSPAIFLAVFLLSFQGIKNIFYVQTRTGLNGQPFRIMKLRTMSGEKEAERKITRTGRWLRK